MRSGVIAAAFAATAIAVPLQERAVVYATDVEMVYVTEIKTVTADGAAPAPSDTSNYYHFGHSPHWWKGPHKAHTQETAPAPAPEPTTAPAPAPEPTTAPAPAPEPTTSDWSQPAPTTEAPPSEPTATSAPISGSPPSDYQGKVLWHHNIHRKNHTSPDIQWSSSLAATALKIAQTCVYAHNTDMDGGGYGQNIAAGVDDSGIDRVITDMFYDGEVNSYEANSNDYTSANPSNFETWGHMSQVVWYNTAEVACATAHCPNGLANTGGGVTPYFTVCNYGPPGNVGGQYLKNVKKPIGNAPYYVN